MRYPILPVPKPRQTRADKWQRRPEVLRYRAFADEVRARQVQLPEEGARIEFVLPMPKSWSQKKRREMEGKPHQQKPDLDNLIKSLCDALYADDCRIWEYAARKVWGQSGAIEIHDSLEKWRR